MRVYGIGAGVFARIAAPLMMADSAADLAALMNTKEEGFTASGGEDLPTQGGSRTPTIMPGISNFRLPANIDQCWEPFDVQKKGPDGTVLTHPAGTVLNGEDVSGKPVIEHHVMLRFDSENPLIVVGGDFDGLPVQYVSISTLPRKRGKDKPGEPAPIVPDMTYFVRKSLKDNTPVHSRGDWMTIVNRHPGQIVTLEHGLSAFCDPERTRYISDGAGGSVEDPDGNKGCGYGPAKKLNARYYSDAFRVDEVDVEGKKTGRKVYAESIYCVNCGAILRGFFRVEKFLEPSNVANAVVAGVGQGTLA